MAKSAWINSVFSGGWSVDEQLGIDNSFAYSRHIDFRKKPSQMTVLPKTRKDSTGVVKDLVQNAVMVNDGTIYMLGSDGFLYRRTTAGAWSTVMKLDNGAYGLSYRSDVDKLFACSAKNVSELSTVTGTPKPSVAKYAASVSTDSNATLTGGTLTSVVGAAISEASSAKQEFASDIEPLSKIQVFIPEAGTGDWTLTLHDPANNTLATSTVTNANIVENQWNDFAFSSQVRIYVKPNARTYHFHLTTTTGDGQVQCATAGDINTCDYKVFADRLIDTRNGMHPMWTFLQYELIGNGNYLSAWEPLSEEPSNSEWLRHKLVFPSGLEVCGGANWREYAAIPCEQRSSSGNAQEGYIFFWDGLSSTYNFFLKVPEGSPYNLHEYKDVLFYEAGGSLFAYAGGQPVKIRTLPNTDSEYSDTTDATITYPYMATVRRGVHLLGFPSQTTNTSVEHGVYSFGAVNKDFDDSFGYNYSISTGTRLNTSGNLRIGMIKNFGDTLFVSWRDDTRYGVDIVDNSSDPYAEAEWRSLFFDGSIPTKDKSADHFDLEFEPLPAGVTVTPKYRTARNGTWTEGDACSTEGATGCRMSINKRFTSIQLGFDVTITGTTTPKFTAVVLVFDDLKKEALA